MMSEKPIYLDNAASSFPKPKTVLKEVNRLLKSNTSNAGRSGHKLSEALAEKIYDTRFLLAEYFGTQDSCIIFTQNATHSINLLLKGILSDGDHIIISDLEHNAVLRPLVKLEDKGVDFDILNTSGDIVYNLEKLIKPNTKLIFVTSASNVTGELLPINSLALIARKHGILFGIDASQSAGYIDYNLKKQDIDFLCTAGHKGLLGIQGSGILAMKNEMNIESLIQGGTGTDSLNMFQPNTLPEALESGTLNSPAIVSMGKGVEYITKYKDKIRKTEDELIKYAHERLKEVPNIKIYSSPCSSTPTIGFNVDSYHSEEIGEYLSENNICIRGGYHCSLLAHKKLGTTESGVCRISFSPFNKKRDVDRMIKCLKKL